MEIKKLANTTLNFIIRRFIELFGILIIVSSFFLLISLISYSPEDPNFINSNNIEIKNFLGKKGSFISDLFYQSLGLISMLIKLTIYSYDPSFNELLNFNNKLSLLSLSILFYQSLGLISLLIPVSLILTGTNIIYSKKVFIVIENIFFIILYSIFGALFFSSFYASSFSLIINGNGGFVGSYLNNTLFEEIINLNSNISYIFLIILIITLFLLSINFKIKFFLSILKSIYEKLFIRSKKNETKIELEIQQNINDLSINNSVQKDFDFQKSEDISAVKKFALPSIKLLEVPKKNENENISNEENTNTDFLENTCFGFFRSSCLEIRSGSGQKSCGGLPGFIVTNCFGKRPIVLFVDALAFLFEGERERDRERETDINII